MPCSIGHVLHTQPLCSCAVIHFARAAIRLASAGLSYGALVDDEGASAPEVFILGSTFEDHARYGLQVTQYTV
jgi:hypothetical protein